MLHIKRGACTILTLLMLFVCLLPVTVFAEEESESSEQEIPSNAQAVIEMVEALPSEKSVTYADKDKIMAVKNAYEDLGSDKRFVGTVNIGKINTVRDALELNILKEVSDRIEALPKKASKSDKSAVTAIWEDYQLLNPDSRDALQKDLIDKLNSAVKAVAPELIEGTDTSSQTESEDKTSQTGTSTDTVQGLELTMIIVAAVFFASCFILLIYVIVLAIKYRRLTRF